MAVDEAKPKAGLEDVVAATSAICYLDGDRGVLAYYGYDIHDLARGATFEEVCYLLWHGRLPTRAELGDLQSQLAAGAPAAGADPPADEAAAGVRRHGRAADADVGARALRSATPTTTRRRRNYRKAVRLTAQIGEHRRHLRPAAGGRRPDPAGSGARPRGELPLHADRRAAERAGDARVRRRAGPARRPRAERLDVRRARRRGDADRHLLGDRRRDRRAEGPAARRRERGGHAAAARDRPGRDAGADRRGDPRQAGAQGEDSGLRPPRLSHRGSARDAPAPHVEGAGRARRQHAAGSRCRSASRRSSRARRS